MNKKLYDTMNDEILRHAIDSCEVARLAKKEKPKRKTKSYRPLHFEIKEEDSPVKKAILRCFNRRDDLTYDSIKDYFSNIMADNPEGARYAAYNLIETLRDRPGMRDRTLSIVLDFLEMDMFFLPRRSVKSDSIVAYTKGLAAELKDCPERLNEVIQMLRNEVEDAVDELDEFNEPVDLTSESMENDANE